MSERVIISAAVIGTGLAYQPGKLHEARLHNAGDKNVVSIERADGYVVVSFSDGTMEELPRTAVSILYGAPVQDAVQDCGTERVPPQGREVEDKAAVQKPGGGEAGVAAAERGGTRIQAKRRTRKSTGKVKD